MEIYKNLFVGDSIKKPEKLIKKLNNGKALKSFYLVGFFKDRENLEIINSRMFLQKYFRSEEFLVTAIVKDEEDALEYIRALCEISFKAFNEFNQRKAVSEISVFEINEKYYEEDR